VCVLIGSEDAGDCNEISPQLTQQVSYSAWKLCAVKHTSQIVNICQQGYVSALVCELVINLCKAGLGSYAHHLCHRHILTSPELILELVQQAAVYNCILRFFLFRMPAILKILIF